ncbi:HAD-superfamily subfamily IIA hydrolase, partial [Phakopsora pachyrhizi]
ETSATCSPDLVWRFKVSFFHSGRINQSQRLPNRNLPAFCFDIDGVLKRGKSVLSEAKEALSILNGVPEEERCQRLSDELGIPQLVQSHTIFTQFLDEYRTKPILVVGGASQRYGFQHVYIPQDILKWNPNHFSKISFRPFFVQLAIDVLTSKGGNPHEQPKIYFSNPDILWGNEFLRPRFGQGAFSVLDWGKPSRVTYEFAEGLLLQVLKESFGNKELGNVYDRLMFLYIETNLDPASDIQGANNFGWVSHPGTIEDSQYPPSTVQPNVLDAVKWALMEEGFSSVV